MYTYDKELRPDGLFSTNFAWYNTVKDSIILTNPRYRSVNRDGKVNFGLKVFGYDRQTDERIMCSITKEYQVYPMIKVALSSAYDFNNFDPTMMMIKDLKLDDLSDPLFENRFVPLDPEYARILILFSVYGMKIEQPIHYSDCDDTVHLYISFDEIGGEEDRLTVARYMYRIYQSFADNSTSLKQSRILMNGIYNSDDKPRSMNNHIMSTYMSDTPYHSYVDFKDINVEDISHTRKYVMSIHSDNTIMQSFDSCHKPQVDKLRNLYMRFSSEENFYAFAATLPLLLSDLPPLKIKEASIVE